MASSTTFTQYAPEITKFGKNKGHFAVQGYSRSPLICDFLLLINTNLPPILHRTVSDIQHSKCPKSLYLATPLAFKSPDRGVPLGRSP